MSKKNIKELDDELYLIEWNLKKIMHMSGEIDVARDEAERMLEQVRKILKDQIKESKK